MPLKMEWNPSDPRGDTPVPGETGHFDHHTWLKEFAVLTFAWMKTVEHRLDKLEREK